MKARYRRLQTWFESWVSVNLIDFSQQLRIQKRVFREVHPITGGKQQMIGRLFAAIAKAHMYLLATGSRRNRVETGSDRDALKAVNEPGSSRRANRTASNPILCAARQKTQNIRTRSQLTHSGGTHIPWRIQESLNRPEAPHALSPAEPANLRRADDHLNASTGFVQEGGRFERTLPATNHENFLVGKTPEVLVIAAMRHQRGRQTGKLRRPPCERRDAGGNDHTRRDQNVAVLRCQLESGCFPLDSGNPAGIEVRHSLLLIPAAVLDETIESN